MHRQFRMAEGEQLQSQVKQQELQERSKFQSYRNKIKSIVEENDQTKYSLMQQQSNVRSRRGG